MLSTDTSVRLIADMIILECCNKPDKFSKAQCCSGKKKQMVYAKVRTIIPRVYALTLFEKLRIYDAS